MKNTKLKRRVLFFSAHPDDELAGAGGFLLKILKEGGKVKLVLCIDPSEPRMDIDLKTERDTRLKEFKKVSKSMGAEDVFLNFSRYPALTRETILSCVKEIRSFKPDIVMMIQEGDYHTEHQMIAKIVKRAVWHAGRSAFPECGKPYKVEVLWEAEGDRPLNEPNHFEDISSVAARKGSLFLLYGSQQARKDLASAVLGLNAFRGIMYKKGRFAEAFKTTEFFYG
ncbi:MAG TPA: PIG-L family deacetylase [Candidatus Paceibacterota bacterium]|jgi:LmbE family N-acetylglucosaminyl deacetylase|nr:PIG-L family deacetylase [Candidatus Paceibacterota bacterium]